MHLTTTQIEAQLDWINKSPSDVGRVDGLCIRPQMNARQELPSCHFSPEEGVAGDFWSWQCWKRLEDGSSDPAVQLAIMNSRAIDVIAGSRDRWKLAGDQLFVDFDLSLQNLSTGDQLQIGGAVVELTDIAHTGCDLFEERFGRDAVKYYNSKAGKALRLRGVYARITQAGEVKVGDRISRVQAGAESAAAG